MDYIPTKNANFVAFAIALSAAITAAPASYGTTAPNAVDLAALVTEVETQYGLLTDPATKTPVVVQNFKGARAAAVVAIRQIAGLAQALPATPEDLVTAGLPVRSTGRTPQSPVVAGVDLQIVSALPEQLKLQARNPENPTSKKKPAGTGALQLAIAIGTTSAVDPSQATRQEYVTKTPFYLNTNTEDRGKVITVFARWQSKGSIGGIKVYGPWSLPIDLRLP